MKLAKRLEDVFAVLYDYDHIDIEKFYIYPENKHLLETLNTVLSNDSCTGWEISSMRVLYDNLSDFISIETNYNSNIGDF